MEKSKTSKRFPSVWGSIFLGLLVIGTVWIIWNQRDVPYQTDEGFIFGTTYKITYQKSDNLKTGIEAELKKVDNALSMFNEESIISQLNQGSTDIPKDEEGQMFTDVLKLALEVSKNTDGAFDITVAPLVNAWGFGFKHDTRPTPSAIDSMKALVGYKKVSLTPSGQVKKSDPRIMLDCSAVAKGYGCDVVARLLSRAGVTNYMIEIGGEIVTHGVSEKRLPWHIGVTVPTDDTLATQKDLQAILNVTDRAMATSGNYRNFYYEGGRKVAHTIDPRTGQPVQHSLLSATVLATDCATADAYATSFMVMGMEKAIKLLERHPELLAYFIYSGYHGENQVWYSPALRDKIQE